MSAERQASGDPRIDTIVSELQRKVIQEFPAATFEVFQGDDPQGTYLRATVDVDDPEEVTDLVIDRLLDLQVEERLPLYFIAARPVERTPTESEPRRPARPHVGVAALNR